MWDVAICKGVDPERRRRCKGEKVGDQMDVGTLFMRFEVEE